MADLSTSATLSPRQLHGRVHHRRPRGGRHDRRPARHGRRRRAAPAVRRARRPRRRHDADEMDEAMAARTKAFPAKTEGLGAQVLAPTRAARRHQAVRPHRQRSSTGRSSPARSSRRGPTTARSPARRSGSTSATRSGSSLNNELPESTAIHFHGLRRPNAMDGVPDITQAPIKPGRDVHLRVHRQGARRSACTTRTTTPSIQVPNGLAGAFLVGQHAAAGRA